MCGCNCIYYQIKARRIVKEPKLYKNAWDNLSHNRKQTSYVSSRTSRIATNPVDRRLSSEVDRVVWRERILVILGRIHCRVLHAACEDDTRAHEYEVADTLELALVRHALRQKHCVRMTVIGSNIHIPAKENITWPRLLVEKPNRFKTRSKVSQNSFT